MKKEKKRRPQKKWVWYVPNSQPNTDKWSASLCEDGNIVGEDVRTRWRYGNGVKGKWITRVSTPPNEADGGYDQRAEKLF